MKILGAALSGVSGLLSVFHRDGAGNVAIAYGLAIPVVIGVAGAALDFGRTSLDKSQVQDTLDSAVLAGIAGPSAEELAGSLDDSAEAAKIAIAKEFFTSNVADQVNIDSLNFHFEGEKLVGVATGSLETSLLNLVGFDSLEFALDSAATRQMSRGPLCFMAMHPTRKHTLELKGTVSVMAPDCHIYGNSSHVDDVVDPHSPQNYLTGKTVSAIGYGHHYIENVTPPLSHASELIPDPLATLVIPTAGSGEDSGGSGSGSGSDDDDFADACDFNDFELSGGSHTMEPGTYCGGLVIENATVFLEPGMYLIADDSFEIDDATLTGEEVAIVLADDDVEIDWKEAVVRISAMTSGPYKSIVLMGVREEVDHEFKDSTVDLTGVVYLPNGTFEWDNKGEPEILGDWTAWIIDGVTWTGSGTIHINYDTANSEVPYLAALTVIPVEGNPRLVY